MGWRGVAAALDAGTAACAAVNATYFVNRLLSGVDRAPSRWLAVATLAVVSLGTLVEALALLAMIAARPDEATALSSASWTLVRLLPFAGAASVSALIARKAVLQ